ncbi:MAG: fibronectin type III domain-containing protein, partial [Desulfuromonadales bacterium]|nr:fibronectin type III domain-containing protein [Desulfuromonadales bacterium]
MGKKTNKGLGGMLQLFLSIMFTLVFFLAGHVICYASTVAIQWDPSTDSELAGYKVYYQTDAPTQPFQGTGATQGSAPIDTLKQTTATISGLDPNHAYYFAVTAYNASGVESSYSNIVSVPELVSPTTSISFPSNNAMVSGTVSVAASASDNVGVTKVEFYVNGVLQTSDSASPYVFSWNTSLVTSGSYTLMTKAYDTAGNAGQSSNVVVTVVNDTTAPTVSLTAPANGVTLGGTTAITASASDNVGVSKVEFYANGVLLFAGNVAPYSYNWDTTSVANGSYTLLASAYDAVGNVGQTSNVVTVNNVVPDLTAPTMSAFSMPSTAT